MVFHRWDYDLENLKCFREAIDIVERNIGSVFDLIDFFVERDLREIPATHAWHDRLIRRLKKFVFLTELWVNKAEWRLITDWDGKLRRKPFLAMINIFEKPHRQLKRIIRILESWKDAIKRERRRILTFVFPWIMDEINKMRVIELECNLGQLSITFVFQDTTWSPHSPFNITVWLKNHRKGTTKTIEPAEAEEILKKRIERLERWLSRECELERATWTMRYVKNIMEG